MNINPVMSTNFKAKFTDNKNLREITRNNDPSNKTEKLARNFASISPNTEIEITYSEQYKQYHREFLEVGLKNLKNNQSLNLKFAKYKPEENLLDNFLTEMIERHENADEFWHADLSPNNKVHNILINKK